MKIAIITRRLNVSGGTQRATICLAHELNRQGHEAALYTFSYSKDECYPDLVKDLKIVVADADVVSWMMKSGGKRGFVGFIRNYIDQNRASRNLAHKIPADTDILNPHDQVVDRVTRYFKREVKRIASVWVVNDVSTKKTTMLRERAFNQHIRPSLLKRIAYWCIDTYEYRYFIRYQDIVAVLDTRDKKWADEQFPRTTTAIVRNGLSVEEFPYHTHSEIRGKKVRLLGVAILLPHRRFEDAITAVALLRGKGFDASLSIIGDRADKKYCAALQALVAQLHMEPHVHFRGKVSHEELLAAYRGSDVFVFPCHLQSWGLAVFEAMASGLPVIVSETSGASEVLQNGENAIITPPYSPERIAEAVESLADPALYQKISKQGRSFVEENISWGRYATSLLDLFNEARANY